MLCPNCGTSNEKVYVGFSTVECTNPRCVSFRNEPVREYRGSYPEWISKITSIIDNGAFPSYVRTNQQGLSYNDKVMIPYLELLAFAQVHNFEYQLSDGVHFEWDELSSLLKKYAEMHYAV